MLDNGLEDAFVSIQRKGVVDDEDGILWPEAGWQETGSARRAASRTIRANTGQTPRQATQAAIQSRRCAAPRTPKTQKQMREPVSSFRRPLPVSTKVRRLPGFPAAPEPQQTRRKVPSLTGMPVWWLIGPNGSAKTLTARWMLERALMAGRGVKAAALDVNTRTLVDYFPAGVDQPDCTDPGGVARWMKNYIAFAAQEKQPALLDMGGGDQALASLVFATPSFTDILAAQGQAAVVAYFLTPQQQSQALQDVYHLYNNRR